MEGVFFILIFVGVIAITAVLFGFWVVAGIVVTIVRLIRVLFVAPPKQSSAIARSMPSVRCANDRCHGMNPSTARFCRRCGSALDVQRTSARRVAVW